ncbi:methylated-DNA--[protein]-cysteine S-methyltransferase [Fibrella sp. HMF5335]|uniref:Methylated-DNA--protein-cysteine methyltransferase n=1 Tax=Fibrella rubiginis TaxID=2817060 RepID=A0A939GJD9_9BACT|nr:methylated-DNA--[protein]-cysteine S-methyltransferase [Fibrella rubiginis]MBO0938878.1 methylated-DNA--[protein]-cysteine S-methyltransferase [Fibrella rubiginis]
MVSYLTSPLGTIRITGDKSGVLAISCLDDPMPDLPLPVGLPAPLQAAHEQLTAYFNGERHTFDFAINPIGTEFQRRVWTALLTVPFGKTFSYLELSRQLGDEKAIRAVAAANGRNPLAIVIPCHRIIGSNGSLTGYAGGLWRKQWLLEHEGSRRRSPEGQLALF